MDMMIDIDLHPVELLELDRLTVWPPYSPMPATALALPVVSASGVRLPDGRDLIDRIPSWWRAPCSLKRSGQGSPPG
jgi:adenosylmethionine-8-amino-7-oxononanoate aminotransferase